MNRFKFLNDHYGHSKGDEALKLVARCIEEEARERNGKAFRFGGDEFALIQEGKENLTDSVEAISSRIQAKINSNLFIQVTGGKFDLAVSVGGAVLRRGEFKGGQTPEEMAGQLIREADARMYADKRRNGVERGK